MKKYQLQIEILNKFKRFVEDFSDQKLPDFVKLTLDYKIKSNGVCTITLKNRKNNQLAYSHTQQCLCWKSDLDLWNTILNSILQIEIPSPGIEQLIKKMKSNFLICDNNPEILYYI